MAARKPGKVTAPVKQKIRKNHGPKRHLFKEFKPMVHIFAATGILSKYYNYESFVQACGARGVRTALSEMWMDYSVLPTIHNHRHHTIGLPAFFPFPSSDHLLKLVCLKTGNFLS